MRPEFGYLEFAEALVITSLVLHVLVVGFSVGGQLIQDRRWIDAARNALIVSGFTGVGAAAGLVAAFISGSYHIEYVYNYSERELPLFFKFAGLWAGLDGSLLFWSTLVGMLAAVVGFQFRRERRHPVGQRMEPNVYVVFSIVQLFFLSVIAFAANPFEPLWESMTREVFLERFRNGEVADGSGLNPLLVNYWMTVHPPSLYFGWVTYTVPFAYGVAALVTCEQGSYWIRKVRGWMMVGWLFNTTGIVLGGLWAYEVLGWGGYWAWDPVENASFLPWFASTAFLHSIMVQERRDMLKGWNSFLVILTFFLSIFGTFLTRSGIVSSVHAFADGQVGWFFAAMMLAALVGGGFLLALRASDLRSRNQIESVFSREAAFVLNNVVLMAIAAAIMILTLWPFLSKQFLGQAITVSVPVYNFVTTPFFVLLLFLTAVGPGLGWIKTTRTRLLKHFGLASVAAVPVAAAVQGVAIWVRGEGEDPVSVTDQLYPGAAINYLSAFIVTTLAFELLRTAGARARRKRQAFLVAAIDLVFRNNRRYGGYLVHVGLAILAMGVVNSSIYKSEQKIILKEGDRREIGGYAITMLETRSDPEHPVYALDHAVLALEREGRKLTTLEPEKRFFRKKQQPTTEVEIYRRPLEDFYVYFDAAEEDPETGQARFDFTIFRNPLILLVWLGWLVMIAGGIWAALPLGQRQVGLAS